MKKPAPFRKTVTLSFTIPTDFSIKIDEYMEFKKIKQRSKLIHSALTDFFRKEEDSENIPRLIKDIAKDVREIKKIISS